MIQKIAKTALPHSWELIDGTVFANFGLTTFFQVRLKKRTLVEVDFLKVRFRFCENFHFYFIESGN